MPSLSDIDKLIEDLIDGEEPEEDEEEVDEANITANIPGYQTPRAFTGKDPKREKKRKKSAEQSGYKILKRTHKYYVREGKSVYKRLMELLYGVGDEV